VRAMAQEWRVLVPSILAEPRQPSARLNKSILGSGSAQISDMTA